MKTCNFPLMEGSFVFSRTSVQGYLIGFQINGILQLVERNFFFFMTIHNVMFPSALGFGNRWENMMDYNLTPQFAFPFTKHIRIGWNVFDMTLCRSPATFWWYGWARKGCCECQHSKVWLKEKMWNYFGLIVPISLTRGLFHFMKSRRKSPLN